MRITELPTVSGASSTDYLAIDDATLGTRKILPENLIDIDGFVSFSEDQTSVIDATEAAQARANIKIGSASTSAEGLVQLYDGVDSTSTTLAASANAVRLAYNHGGGGSGSGIGENILDNPYFLNPVNQRGQNTYTGLIYTIDRWKLGRSDMTANVTSSGLNIVMSGTMGRVRQYFVAGLYRGLTLTASVLMSDGTLLTGTATAPTADNQAVPFDTGYPSGYPELEFETNTSTDAFCIKCPASMNKTMVAAKLEIGRSQTLCVDNSGWELTEIPNISEQLERCQRFYYRMHLAAWQLMAMGVCSAVRNIAYTIPFPRMHKAPTMSSPYTIGLWSSGGAWATVSSFTVKYTPNSPNLSFDVNPSVNCTVGLIYAPVIEAGGYIDFDADL